MNAARNAIRATLAALAVATLAGCSGSVGVGIDVSDDPPPPPPQVVGLYLSLTRLSATEIQIDWSDDPGSASFTVYRDDRALASTNGLALIDASVVPGYQYCYQVTGFSPSGRVTSVSSTACIVAGR